MAGYVGNVPVPQSVREDQSFTATAGQTTFNTLGYTDGTRIKVTLNGVLLEGGGVDYTATNGSDVVLTSGAAADDIVRFETFNEVNLVSSISTTPTFKTSATLLNETEEDIEGGRESTLIFQGEQSGGELSTLAEIEASHDGTSDDEKGDLIFRTNDGNDGTSPTERLRINSAGDMLFSSDDPSITIANTTHEDTDGGRESTIVFQGEQSGGEVSTLAQIEAAHDGTADDEKGDLIFRTNDGSDGASPTEAMRITSGQRLGLGENDPDTNFHIDATSSGNFTEAMRISNTGGGANEGNYIQWEVANTNGYGPRIGGRREGTGGVGLHFYTGEISGAPVERWRIDHDGHFKAATNGLGIDFSAVETAGANPTDASILDDYEEGAFTPTLSFATAGNSSVGYSARTGVYIKIGKVVTFQLEMRMNGVTKGTGSGHPIVGGFPFNFHNSGGYGGSYLTVSLQYTGITSGHTPYAWGNFNSDFAYLVTMSNSSANTSLPDPSTYAYIGLAGSYLTTG